ncbi:MAG: hypothetical protein WKG07_29850 [Hymenobacter sp.]
MKKTFGAAAMLLACLLSGPPAVQAQTAPPAPPQIQRYFVFFKDKAGTPYTVGQPQAFCRRGRWPGARAKNIVVRARDLPVSPAYLAQVRAVSGSPRLIFPSRWLNGAVLACDSLTLTQVHGSCPPWPAPSC